VAPVPDLPSPLDAVPRLRTLAWVVRLHPRVL
jgi:hypothetical protein